MSWAKWDAEHPYQHKEGGGGERSADKLAAMIKSTVGNHEGTRAEVRPHGSGGSVVHKTTKGDLKRPVQPKGHKDRGDSARTTIRMAAHYRGKRGEEVGPTGEIKPESGNTGKLRSADKLVAARDERPKAAEHEPIKGVQRGKEAAYTKAADRATKLSDSANTAEEHRAASAAHAEAAKSSFGTRLSTHNRLAENHARQADVEDKMAATAAAREAKKGQPKVKPTIYEAEHNGMVRTRTSPRPYTHAAVYKDHEGKEYIGSFHESYSGASKGTNGVKPIKVVAVTKRDEKPKSSAQKIADQMADRPSDDRARQHYNMVADRANKASDVATTSGGHDIAAQQHERAAELAPTANHRTVHEKLAANHRAQAENERKGEALAAERKKADDTARAAASKKADDDRKAAQQRLAARSADMHAARIERESGPRDGIVAMKDIDRKSKAGSMTDEDADRAKRYVKKSYADQRKTAISAEAKADLSGSEADRAKAVEEHTKAAVMAHTTAQRSMHAARAENLRSGKAKETKPLVSSTKAVVTAKVADGPGGDYESARKKATSMGSEAQTPEEHQAAAQAHREAAALAPTAAGRAVHNARVNHHVDAAANSARPKSDTSAAAEAATRKAKANPTPENHRAAEFAHRDAFNDRANHLGERGTTNYHRSMEMYHRSQGGGGAAPDSDHAAASGYRDLDSLQRSKADYASVASVKKTGATDAELDSIGHYTRGSDEAINSKLRGLTVSGYQAGRHNPAELEDHISNLDSAFDRQPPLDHELTTYRGVENADRLFGKVGERVGGEFVDKGYSSTSTHADVAHDFGASTPGGALLRIKTAEGTKVMNPVSASKFGSHEQEILMPRGSSYRITGDRMVRTNTGNVQRQIDLEHTGTGSRSTEDEIEAIQRDHPNVSLSVQRSASGHLVISKIVVPKESRGRGTGGAIMKRITDAADRNGDSLALTPSKDFGGTVSRLQTFYKGHGFKPNTGRSRDLTTRETMIREPKR